MKLLYLSCHAILEYDELKLFQELGIDYFSLGSYLDPKNPVDQIRPALTKEVDMNLYGHAPDRMKMPQEFIDKFDVIMIMHVPEWIYANWERMKHKTVIWRTIGQSTPAHEEAMQPYVKEGLKVVRYSPREAEMNSYCGQSEVIRFYKDPEEFNNWNGNTESVITIAQNMKERGEFCNFPIFENVTRDFPRKLYGTKNENAGELSGGYLSYEDMKQKYRDNRVYFYTGTQPACYTLNFIEAWMTGIPIVAIGSTMANSLQVAGDSYEIPELLKSAPDCGIFSDDLGTLKLSVQELLRDRDRAQRIGENGRRRAIEVFGKETIKSQWKAFFDTL